MNQGASLFFLPALFFSAFSRSFRAVSLASSCAASLRPSLLREIYVRARPHNSVRKTKRDSAGVKPGAGVPRSRRTAARVLNQRVRGPVGHYTNGVRQRTCIRVTLVPTLPIISDNDPRRRSRGEPGAPKIVFVSLYSFVASVRINEPKLKPVIFFSYLCGCACVCVCARSERFFFLFAIEQGKKLAEYGGEGGGRTH